MELVMSTATAGSERGTSLGYTGCTTSRTTAHWAPPSLEAAAVDEQGVAGFAHDGDKLVHDAARHPGVAVLSGLEYSEEYCHDMIQLTWHARAFSFSDVASTPVSCSRKV